MAKRVETIQERAKPPFGVGAVKTPWPAWSTTEYPQMARAGHVIGAMGRTFATDADKLDYDSQMAQNKADTLWLLSTYFDSLRTNTEPQTYQPGLKAVIAQIEELQADVTNPIAKEDIKNALVQLKPEWQNKVSEIAWDRTKVNTKAQIALNEQRALQVITSGDDPVQRAVAEELIEDAATLWLDTGAPKEQVELWREQVLARLDERQAKIQRKQKTESIWDEVQKMTYEDGERFINNYPGLENAERTGLITRWRREDTLRKRELAREQEQWRDLISDSIRANGIVDIPEGMEVPEGIETIEDLIEASPLNEKEQDGFHEDARIKAERMAKIAHDRAEEIAKGKVPSTNGMVKWKTYRKLAKDPESVTDEYLEGLVKPDSLTGNDIIAIAKIRDTKEHPLKSSRYEMFSGILDELYIDVVEPKYEIGEEEREEGRLPEGYLERVLEYDQLNEELKNFFETSPDAQSPEKAKKFFEDLTYKPKQQSIFRNIIGYFPRYYRRGGPIGRLIWGEGKEPEEPKEAEFYDYEAARKAGITGPDETGHWPSEFKKEGHPNLFIDGLDTRTATRQEIIRTYIGLSRTELGADATSEQIAKRAKEMAKEKGWKIE